MMIKQTTALCALLFFPSVMLLANTEATADIDALLKRVEMLEKLARDQEKRISRFRERLEHKTELLSLTSGVIKNRDWPKLSKEELEKSLAEQFRNVNLHKDTLREFAYIFRNYSPEEAEKLPGNKSFYLKMLVREKVIYHGMTVADLRNIVGNPEETKTEETVTFWSFDLYREEAQSFMTFKLEEDKLKEVYVHHRKKDTTHAIRFPSS